MIYIFVFMPILRGDDEMDMEIDNLGFKKFNIYIFYIRIDVG